MDSLYVCEHHRIMNNWVHKGRWVHLKDPNKWEGEVYALEHCSYGIMRNKGIMTLYGKNVSED